MRAATLAPAKGKGAPVDGWWGWREPSLQLTKHPVGALDQVGNLRGQGRVWQVHESMELEQEKAEANLTPLESIHTAAIGVEHQER